MKVRILSGSQRGAVVDQPRTEAESNIATGFAEAYVEAAPAPRPEPEPKKKAEPKK